jgi:hypothetical protein
MKLKTLTQITIALFCLMLYSCQKEDTLISPTVQDNTTNNFTTLPVAGINIPMGGNAYITQSVLGGTETINASGLTNWSNENAITSAFFRVGKAVKLSLSIKASVPSGASTSTIRITANGIPYDINISGSTQKNYFVGAIDIPKAGYIKVDFKGINKGTNPYFANVTNIVLTGLISTTDLVFANNPSTFNATRKGSVLQLQYTIPLSTNAEWFYNELTVPNNSDKAGSFFVSNGFVGGELGLKINSATDRKIVFTVNDNLNYKASIVNSGANVINSALSGAVNAGQSTLDYNWKAGTTYKFLTQGKPDGAGNTVFSAWFYATETAEWKFIASWKRPNFSNYLKNIYSSLQGTNAENSFNTIKVRYNNQWLRDNNGNWTEVTNADFNGDATASNAQRMDYKAGVDFSSFFLQTNGFFSDNIALKTNFTRTGSSIAPTVDVNNLPQ